MFLMCINKNHSIVAKICLSIIINYCGKQFSCIFATKIIISLWKVWPVISSILTIQITCFDFPYWKKYFHYLWLFPKFTILTCLWKTLVGFWNFAITNRDYHYSDIEQNPHSKIAPSVCWFGKKGAVAKWLSSYFWWLY